MKFLLKSLSVVATVSAGALLAMGVNTFSHQNVAVASAANTLTGSCGGVFSFQKKGRSEVFDQDNEPLNALFHVDFDGADPAIYVVFTQRDTSDDQRAGYKTTKEGEAKFAITSIVPHAHLPGAFKVTYLNNSFGKSFAQSANFKPVNGGTTFLVQIVSDDITGLCQKL